MKFRKLYIILFVLLLPLMFIAPHEEERLITYLFKLLLPLSIVFVCWVNYRWLLPRYFRTHHLGPLALRNALVIFSCVALLSVAHTFEFKYIHRQHPDIASLTHPNDEKKPRHKPREEFDFFAIFLGMRDGVYLLLGFFMAYVVLSRRRVERLQQEKQEAEAARQAAELCGLLSQVSPHFLLNTLNGIYALSLAGDERTSDAIIRLAQLLRHTLYDAGGERVSLRSEADFVRAYAELMALRLTDNVSINLQLNIPTESTTEVAPFIILSLLENAFKHGTDADHPCHVDISMSEDDHQIVIRMANSYHPKGQDDHSGHGIGMELVHKRLEYAYPQAYEWTYGVVGNDWVTQLSISKHPHSS